MTLTESGDGEGGYAKLISKEFIDAEMALFRAQAAEVNVVITTALVPGTRAPTLVPKDVAEALAPGSVIVDLAAEQGGNCELTKPGEVVVHRGVTIIGHVDLVSRMAATASRLFATNLFHLLVELGAGKGGIAVDLENDVVRPALLTYDGEILPPPPRKEPSPAPRPRAATPKAEPEVQPAARPEPAGRSTRPPPPDAKPHQSKIGSPTRRAWGGRLGGMIVIALLFGLGRSLPETFLQHFTVFILACFVGWQVIWSVSPALHTPLMSVTNAISGIIIIGGMLEIGPDLDLATILGALAVLVAAINVAGGFLVTHRMLRMFKRG